MAQATCPVKQPSDYQKKGLPCCNSSEQLNKGYRAVKAGGTRKAGGKT